MTEIHRIQTLCGYCQQIFIADVQEGANPPRFCSTEHRDAQKAVNTLRNGGTLTPEQSVALERVSRERKTATPSSNPANEAYVAKTYGRAPVQKKQRWVKPSKPAPVVVCPQPYKKVYRTQQEAQQFIKETHPGDDTLRPYRCRCGALHIGHAKPKPAE